MTTNDRVERYLKQRIENLLEEAGKNNNDYDTMWYKRTAQELEWALEISTNEKRAECVIGVPVQQDLF